MSPTCDSVGVSRICKPKYLRAAGSRRSNGSLPFGRAETGDYGPGYAGSAAEVVMTGTIGGQRNLIAIASYHRSLTM
jgi:hypothetical protein